MNLSTITIEPEQAEAELATYAELTDRSAEDDAIAMGLRAAKRGLPIIVLSECIRAGGFFDDGYPRLAVARADAKQVTVRFPSNGDLVYEDGVPERWVGRNRGALVGADTVRVRDVMPTHGWLRTATTVVPSIPPRHRPNGKRIGLFHVLWEVEKWDRTPPVDPALIRHIRGDLWAVVATWDLTDLERAVLAQRA